ncbi:MAG: hypothetical protein V1906_03625 [Candidatus Woesearchaeota archaeon]
MQLNDPIKYREYIGTCIDSMRLIRAHSREPMTFHELMARRVEVLGSDSGVYDSWWDNDFSTDDAIAFHPDGKIKVVRDSARLKGITADCKLENGFMALEDGEYESFDGLEMTLFRLERKYGLNRQLSKDEALKHPIWNYLARDDEIFSAYAEIMFTKAVVQLQNAGNMGFFFYEYTESPSISMVRMNNFYGRSTLIAERLDKKSSRMVGVVESPLLITQSLKRLILCSEGVKRELQMCSHEDMLKKIIK